MRIYIQVSLSICYLELVAHECTRDYKVLTIGKTGNCIDGNHFEHGVRMFFCQCVHTMKQDSCIGIAYSVKFLRVHNSLDSVCYTLNSVSNGFYSIDEC